jgi:xylulokinase
MSLPAPGRAEMDAERDFWGDLVAVVRDLLARCRRPVVAVAVSGLGPCLVRVDARGEPRAPAILYGIDSRAGAEVDELTRRFGARKVFRRAGKHLTSQALGPKLLWSARHDPGGWDPADRWHSSHSYVVERLTGEWVLDHHTASQCDPFYDIEAQDWARDWVDEVFGHLALPRLAWPAEVVGEVSAAAAAATGLPAGVPVVAGTVDAWAEAFGAGVRRPGDLMLMYGSTTFMIQILPAVSRADGLWTTSGVEPGTHTFAAGMATSGSLTTWLKELTGDVPWEELIREASAVPMGSEGLVLLPYFAGERSPIFDPDARGAVLGLTLRHTRGHLLRAAYEGIAFGVRQIFDVLDAAAGPPLRVVAVGGGTQAELWMQTVSDVTGVEQQVPRQTIGASYGSALLAAVGAALVDPAEDWSRVVATVTPRPGAREVYGQQYDVYRQLYPATRDLAHALARGRP